MSAIERLRELLATPVYLDDDEIEEVLSALPLLLDVAEAARKVEIAWTGDENWTMEEETAAVNALRDALAALDKLS